MNITELPQFPPVRLGVMRKLEVNETAVFSHQGRYSSELVTSNGLKLKRKFRSKKAALVDPITCQSVKVLCVTRIS